MRTTELEEKDQQAGLDILWNFIKDNIQLLVKMYEKINPLGYGIWCI